MKGGSFLPALQHQKQKILRSRGQLPLATAAAYPPCGCIRYSSASSKGTTKAEYWRELADDHGSVPQSVCLLIRRNRRSDTSL